MIAKLKKLEASDGIAVNAMPLDFEKPQAKAAKPAGRSPELQMLSVPRDGWLSGPGRRFNCA